MLYFIVFDGCFFNSSANRPCFRRKGGKSWLFAPELLLGLFDPTEEFKAIGISALRIVSISFPMAGVSIAVSATFQALGVGIYATITSLCRQLLVLVPVAYLLSLTGDVHLVWWAFAAAELVCMVLSLLFFRRIYRNKIKPLYSGACEK